MNSNSTSLKSYFITGLILLLPVALTLVIVGFIINLLTEPFMGIVKAVLDHYGIFIRDSEHIQRYLTKLIILVLLFFCTVGLGFLARWFFFHYLIRFWERTLKRIPIIRGIYKTSQDVTKTLFTADSSSFKQVVLVPFPTQTSLSIGLITKENLPAIGNEKTSRVTVFVPTAPNPTSGFLLLFNADQLTYVDMKVEDALKYVISCGLIEYPLSNPPSVTSEV